MPPSELVLTDSERRLALGRIAGFDRLASEELAAIAKRSRRHEYVDGELLIDSAGPAEPRTTGHLLVSGAVDVTRAQRTWTWRPPHPHIDPFWLARDPTPLEARARGGAVTLSLAFDELEELFADHFALWLGTTNAVAGALIELGPRLADSVDKIARVRAQAAELDRFSVRLGVLRAGLTFAGGAIEALAQLANAAAEVTLPAGATLWHAGEAATALVVPVEGALRGVADSELGALGTLALLAGRPHLTTITAVTRVRALSIDGESLFDVLEDHQDLARDCVAFLATVLLRRIER